jgi:hypothetical protein
MSSKQKAKLTQSVLLALLTAQADRDELDATIRGLTRSLANAHDIPSSYPPLLAPI